MEGILAGVVETKGCVGVACGVEKGCTLWVLSVSLLVMFRTPARTSSLISAALSTASCHTRRTDDYLQIVEFMSIGKQQWLTSVTVNMLEFV